jgi:ketosteroid isomerase-like protein
VSATDADVAVVRRAFEDFEVRPDRIEGYFARFWHADAVIESPDGFPVPGSYRGLEGYRRWFEDTYGPYDDVRRQLHSLTAEGDCVVMLLTITGRPREDDVELELNVGSTYEIEDGRIRRMCVYVGHEHALRAARATGRTGASGSR